METALMSDQEHEKQRYERPTLRKIDLAAEEVLAVGCKSLTRSGPTQPCTVTVCATLGTS
jgi:hypothetical protein